MKSGGVFLGGLGSVLACNLMLIGVCSSEPAHLPTPPAMPPCPAPPLVVRMDPKPVEAPSAPVPLGLFLWGCGAHLTIDPEGVLPLPICASLPRL